MRLRLIACSALALLLAVAAPAFAQGPAAPSDPHRHDAPAPSTPAPPGGAQEHGAVGGAMPMEMCRQMMGVSMMGGMMPMGGGPNQPADPKAMVQMMEMRGEMMKAMGEVMMKHARKMNHAGEPSR
jgi:hypothetical protein